MHTVTVLVEVPCAGQASAAPSDSAILQALAQAQGTFRRQQLGLAPAWSWPNALVRCAGMTATLDRAHLVALLERGSDQAFQRAVLAQHDGGQPAAAPVVYLWEWASALDRAQAEALPGTALSA